MVLEKKKKHISIRKEFSEKIFTPACMANPNRLYHQYWQLGKIISFHKAQDVVMITLPGKLKLEGRVVAESATDLR